MRRPKLLALLVLASAIAALSLHGCIAAPRYYGPVSDHFDGEEFKNEGPYENRNLWHVLKWRLTSEPVEWPDWVDIAQSVPPERVHDGVRITFVNHASVLIQMHGLNILTDPVWCEKTGPMTLGPSRHKLPGIKFEDLPPIDVIVISHNHYDHLDIPTLERLQQKGKPVVFVGLGTKRLLEKQGLDIRAVDLDWWQSKVVDGVRITFTPSQHWSTRVLIGDRNVNLWGSWHFSDGQRSIYFAGDTADGPHFAQVKERLGAPDVALLPIGAYEPRWFMKPQHMNPTEAVAAHTTLAAKKSVAIHWGTFRQTDEGIDDPKTDLAKALGAAGLEPQSFIALENGEFLTLP